MGPDFILLNISLDFKDAAVAPEIEVAISEIDAEIKQWYPAVKRIFIEAESRVQRASSASEQPVNLDQRDSHNDD